LEQLTLTLVIVCSALAGIVLSLLWLRYEGSADEFDELERTAKRRRRRRGPVEEAMASPPPPTPDLVAIQEMWKASVDESDEDPDTAWSSPGHREAAFSAETLLEPPTFPSSPGMKAFLEEEIASLPPPTRKRRRSGVPYPEALGTADDFVRATQSVVLRSDRGRRQVSDDPDE